MSANPRGDSSVEESPYQSRLGGLARQIEGLEAALDDEMKRRNALIVAAVDDGWPIYQVAKWAGLSRTRIHKVLATPALAAGVVP